MRTKLLCFFVGLVLLAGATSLRAQGTTAFSYQGQLRDGGTNANGTYAMTFKLFDAVSSGIQIGGTLASSPTLANGLFTVNLDFGAGAFNGTARWLEINVAGDTLTPRVQVLPAPYALYAAVAATVTNHAIMNSQLATNAVATTNLQNNAVTTAQIADGAVTNRNLAANAVNANNIASGQVVKTVNGLTDSVTLSAGANAALFTNGNGLQISAGVPSLQVFMANGTFIVPTNVTKIMVEMWGGGGGGGLHGTVYVTNLNAIYGYYNSGGGGGAGGYAWNVFSVVPGTSYAVTVGSGGGPADNGGASSFGGLMSAGGGFAGTTGGINPGIGGNGGAVSGSLIPTIGGAGQSVSLDGNGYAFDYANGGNGGSAVRGGSGGWGNHHRKDGAGPGGGGGGQGLQGGFGNGGPGGVIVYY